MLKKTDLKNLYMGEKYSQKSPIKVYPRSDFKDSDMEE